MSIIDHRTSRIVFTLLLYALALLLVYAARRPLLTVIFAIIFAYVLEPTIIRVQPWLRGSRLRAIGGAYVALLVLVAALVAFVSPRVAGEAQTLGRDLPSLLEKISSGQIAFQMGQQRGWSHGTQVHIQQFLATHRAQIVETAQGVGRYSAEVAANLGWVLLIPILAFFFLKDKTYFGSSIVESFQDRPNRAFLQRVFTDLDTMLAQYIRAQLLLSAFAIVAYTAFLLIFRFPYAIAIGVIAGVLEFLPFVGPLLTAAIILGISFLTGYPHWLLLVGFIILWRLVQDYVNTPLVMGEGLELHPAVAIVAVLIGGEVGGVAGMFLSVPVVAGLRILWRNWRVREATPAIVPTPAPARQDAA
jgi:predicted PurR-regulated permease PerM